MKKISVLLLFVFISLTICAQNTLTSAAQFLLIPASPNSMSMGQTSLVSYNDPMMMQFNPANVVDFQNSFQYVTFGGKLEWLPLFHTDNSLYSFGFSASYDLSIFTNEIPIFLSAGYMRTKFDMGESEYITDNNVNLGRANSFDINNQFTIGFGLNYLIRSSFGFSVKNIYSELPDFSGNSMVISKPSTNAYDFGFKVIAPLISITENLNNKKIELFPNLTPIADLTIGGSLLNFGKEVVYTDKNQGDPLPRTARLGYSFKFGLDYQFEKTNIMLAEATITREVYDLLFNYVPNSDSSSSKVIYQNFPGDIKFFDNFIQGKSNKDIFFVQGYEIGFAETFYLKGGNFIGEGFQEHVLTEGYSLTTKGLTKFVNETGDLDPLVKYIFNHFEIQYFSVKYGVGHPTLGGTKSNSISLTFKGF